MHSLCVFILFMFLPCTQADAAHDECSIGTPELEAAEAKAPNTTKGVYSGWEQLDIDIHQQCYDGWYSTVRDEFTKEKPPVCGDVACGDVQSYLNEYRDVICHTTSVCAGLHTLLINSTVDFRELICAWYDVDQGSDLTCGASTRSLTVLPLFIAALTAVLGRRFH